MTERNSLIETLQRHLAVQELANRLLLAELDRLDLDVQYLGELRSRGVIRRWQSYHGREYRIIHDACSVSRPRPYCLCVADDDDDDVTMRSKVDRCQLNLPHRTRN